jgi:hypothetical protein
VGRKKHHFPEEDWFPLRSPPTVERARPGFGPIQNWREVSAGGRRPASAGPDENLKQEESY